ncbi:hypothetical protein [Hansschlegelia sp. KR7-227]|uniref:hypothetical protein n=1 Tax=Hansschlegelia sp. KR7-227 TaxID=3400914 RepID=UPI003C059C11
MNDAAILATLDGISRELERLRETVRDRMNPKVALVTGLAEAMDRELFTASDVTLGPKLTEFPRLAAAVEATCGGSTRGLGRVLASLEDQAIGGLVVMRRGEARGHVLWEIVVAPVR